ncbi:ectonucleotide pyrophosphatase/phosphodiesterase family member 5-like [Anneissia japonica]|uniref:ectonucleotide pyrophosphatase/phosphodiesterase family member 5-like n=1 Tax=Anneissia japonica TaxID=1529436 RepID=UPI001425B52C|nr:ectonucleotide pyrophosphatase/phosphodiesterase family member 5-like [Anneissia japonica]
MEVLRVLCLSVLFLELGAASGNLEQRLIFILLDGLRYDYIDSVYTPNMDEMAAQGVKVDYLTNVFPTFIPSKISLVTGLYPESHGLVHNHMYDSVHNSYAMTANKNDSYWWNSGIAEPIWVTARKQKKTSGSIDYIGGFAEFGGVRPNKFTDNPIAELRSKIDTAINWLRGGMDVVVVEWTYLDVVGHMFGPLSTQVGDGIKKCDENIGYLRQKIREFGLEDQVNIIIAGDHGMTEVSNNNVINLSDIIDLDNTIAYIAESPIAMILPKDGFLETMYIQLKNAHPNMTVYKKEDIPEYYHYRDHYRILPIVAIADLPWIILANGTDVGQMADHGFNNEEISMKSMMLAEGPAFRSNFSVESLNAIDMYELMCKILHLKPAPNNGSLANIQEILVEPSSATACGIYTLLYPILFILLSLTKN